ncbi:MAG: DUF885 family protein [Aestuariibacter sp.]
MQLNRNLIALGIVSAMLTGCGSTTTSQTNVTTTPVRKVQTQSESERLAAYFHNEFQQDLKDSPMYQSYLGIKWNYGEWDQISEEEADKNAAKLRRRFKDMTDFDETSLSEQEKLSIALYKADITRKLANDEFRHHTYIMDQFRAWHTQIPSFLINIHRVTTVSDAEAYVSRLEGVNTLLSQVNEQLDIRTKLGVFPPKWSYDQMIEASMNVIKGAPFDDSGEDSTILADFKDKVTALAISDEAKQTAINSATDALLNSVKPGYQNLIAKLQEQQALSPEGDGVWRLPEGDKWYKNRLAWFTTTDLNADDVHNIGLNHVERIHTAMRDIMHRVNFQGSLNDFFEFMRTDKQFYYPDSDAGRDKYMSEAKALIDELESMLPDYFGLIPKAPMEIKRVEAFREKSAGKAFYQRPAPDGSRPGVYYANLYDMNSMPTYQMEALAYHEGIPGHHMQLAIAQELQGVPDFQKYVSFTAYTEGWGLYSEELAKDMGFYRDPYSDFGRLAMELWRACRLVVDTGIHAKKWSREHAIQYLIDNTPNPERDAVKAIERYIAMPGQATAYMIGKLKIMELRDWAQEYLGDQFDIRGFHDEILKDGPVPLNILEKKIKRWAKDVKNA